MSNAFVLSQRTGKVTETAKRAPRTGVSATKHPFHTVNGRVVPMDEVGSAKAQR